jgi:dTDP-4-dehydrorhamnose reductase
MRILITGGTGLVGSNVIKVTREKYQAEIIASLFSSRPEVPWDFPSISMDLEDVASVRQAVMASRSDVVIHCAAPRDEDRLEIDHAWGWAVMVTSTQALAEACREVGAKLIFVSSDWVFGNGGEPPYSEDSPPCPVNYFGLLKVVGETLVSAICEDYAIVRIAGVYGPNWCYPSYEQTEAGVGFGWLANYFIYRLSRGQPVVVWTDRVNVLANPSLASDIADALLTIAAQDQRGIFHCCGRDSVNRLELAQAVAEVFGYDGRLVRPASTEEMDVLSLHGKLTAPRDSRLKVAHSEAQLGRVNLGLREGLEEYRRQLEQISKP